MCNKNKDSSLMTVQYVGCLGINTSMKSLDFETRSQIAKECIHRICEAGGLKTADKKRRQDKRISRMLSNKPNMDKAGSNVLLSVTSSYLCLRVMETGEIIANHEMPNISFASGGDSETLDFVAYVAKDSKHGRACFVLECGGGLAQELITTIGQAFEMRFKEFLKRAPKSVTAKLEHVNPHNGLTVNCTNDQVCGAVGGTERDYYNDLPGKMPPDIALSTAAPRPAGRKLVKSLQDHSPNLIDLTTDFQFPSTSASSSARTGLEEKALRSEPEYVNFQISESPQPSYLDEHLDVKDPFDMQPFHSILESVSDTVVDTVTEAAKSAQLIELEKQEWYHGPISRKESEVLVAKDGDFLIRDSQATSGQYVLTGMQGGVKKHLLLVDPEGVVRTKDKTFESVCHLINYHRDNGLPIVTAESILILRTPVKVKR